MSIIELVDNETGCRAKIAPQRGFNCYSFEAVVDCQRHEVLWSAPGFDRGEGRASGSGIPLLFPFAGRIRGTSFSWEGKTYELSPGDAHGNAIHGFVIDRPWRVTQQEPTAATAEFQASRDAPEVLPHWPGDFRIAVRYELRGPATLDSQITISNPGAGALPYWFGTHPYFRVPLGIGSQADSCQVTVPAAEYWELVDMLPTGKRLPAEGGRALQRGMSFAQTQLDDVFTALVAADRQVVTRIDDSQAKRSLVMMFETAAFRECVVYNPPHREAICLEPYTAVPDAFTLGPQGIPTGLVLLAPGESRTTRITIQLDRR